MSRTARPGRDLDIHLLSRPAAALLFVLLISAAARAACTEGDDVGLWTSPRTPVAGEPMRVVVVWENGPPGGLSVRDPDGRTPSAKAIRHEGPPRSAVVTIDEPERGVWRIEAVRGGGVVSCREVEVGGRRATDEPRSWGIATEGLYSAWIEHLFGAASGQPTTLRALEEVLRDPRRNFLYDHLGLGEDGPGGQALRATPDCADMPYFLRAYFAWKIGLPFGCRACSRGTASTPPTCGRANVATPANGAGSLGAFAGFLAGVADTVQSGNARTALEDEATDFYPVPLERWALRPGTIYADPYGHTLMIVRWVAQAPGRPGLLLAVDAQPDNSMGYKRFWEGTFLFADVPNAGPGFKAFRPLVHATDGGPLRPLGNGELTSDSGFTPYSDAQLGLDPDEFYARMARLINPSGLPPSRAYSETLDALVEQLDARIDSIDNGERWRRDHASTVVPMPEGATIFETEGPWEDYATPSRDMRVLIAIDVLERLPARLERHPELFVLGGRSPATARASLEALHEHAVAGKTVSYTRSDGSTWTLTVAEVLARQKALEMGYNPNDCVEVRWGAPEGSKEMATCRRHAPADQRARMASYREWFHERRRPPR